MRWLLILPIRIYRLLPARLKRHCLFRETCSLFVMRAAAEGGLLAGCRAMRSRAVRCRPNYSVSYHHGGREWQVTLADGTRASTDELADFILDPYQSAQAECEARALTIAQPRDVVRL